MSGKKRWKKFCALTLAGTMMGSCLPAAAPAEVLAEEQAKTTYETSWESVEQVETAPEWFQDAKFGIYFHWGAFTTPEKIDEWYGQHIYNGSGAAYDYHVNTYGDLLDWPYHNFMIGAEDRQGNYVKFIPQLTSDYENGSAEGKFDPKAWAKLFKEAGAKFAGPVMEHHDGFSMWDSDVTPWNSVDLGPQLDLAGMFVDAIRDEDMKVLSAMHHAYNVTGGFYASAADEKPWENPVEGMTVDDMKKLYGQFSTEEERDEFWLAKLKEIIDKYDPDIIWQDFEVGKLSEEARLEFLSYFYNKNEEDNGEGVVATYKYNGEINDGFTEESAVPDYERGGPGGIKDFYWLTDDSVSQGTWSYTEGMTYYSAKSLIHALADKISKNGNLLLNISPRADGSIPEEQQTILLEIGDWLKRYGEAVYSTRAWSVYGEGPTVMGGGVWQTPTEGSAEDIRFTRSKDSKILYAIALGDPEDGTLDIRTLKEGVLDKSAISGIYMADGTEAALEYVQDENGLHITLPSAADSTDLNGRAVKIVFQEEIPDIQGVTLWSESDYKGTAATLVPGEYNVNELADFGVEADTTSSVQVPEGYSLYIYDEGDNSGAYGIIEKDTASLGNWNDKIASVRVVKNVDVKATVEPEDGKTYQIVLRNNPDFVLEYNGPAENGANVQIGEKADGAANQQWTFTKVEDCYKISPAANAEVCIDISDASYQNGSNLLLWEYGEGADNRLWKLETTGSGYYAILSKGNNGFCMDESSDPASDNANVHLWDYLYGDRQQWCLSEVEAAEPPAEDQETEAAQFMDFFLPMPIIDPDGLSADCWGASEVGARDQYNGLEDSDMSDYSYWDGSIIKDDDTGKYYMFASRWNQAGGHWGQDGIDGWQGSQAIYAVSDNLYGPYEDQGPLWPEYYEGAGHNVFAFELSDQDPLVQEGYRYAIVVSDVGKFENEVNGTFHIAKSLNGEWEHKGKMQVDTNNFGLSNISIIVRPDGRYQAINRNGDIATSDSLLGNWQVESTRLWWNVQGMPSSNVEDPVIWYSDGLYHCVANKWDAKQAYYLTSKDGLTNWTLQSGTAYTPTKQFLEYEDGTENNWAKLERPNVYIEDGALKAVTFAVIDVEKEEDFGNDSHGSKIIVVPFDGTGLKDFVEQRYEGVLPTGDSNIQTWQDERYYNYGAMEYFQVQRDQSTEGLGESGQSGWWWPEDWEYDCKIGFLKYDLSEAVPEGEKREIENAYISLVYLGKGSGNANTDSVRAVLCDPSWNEGTGTGEDTEEADLACLNLPKLDYDVDDLKGTSAVSEEFATNDGLKTVKLDVTELMKKYMQENPDAQYISFALNEVEAGNRLQFGTKEAGEGYGARLIINYGESVTDPEDPDNAADKSSLSLAVAMAEKLEAEQNETGCYTEESWAAVQEALDHARSLMEDENASQEDVDNAFLELITACNLLENEVQRVALQAAVDGAKAILADEEGLKQYTAESVEAVRAALAEAERVLAEEAADQETVNAAARALMDAVTSLVVIDTDTRLDILIQKAEEQLENRDQYTSASVKNLEDALAAAKETAGNGQASEEERNAAYNTLAEAMASLVRKAEKSELANALEKANEILAESDRYVEETITGLQAAVDEAQAVYDNEEADSSEVGEAVKVLVAEVLKARLLGDVDGNGAVETQDAAEVLKYAAETKELTEVQVKAADVNRDAVSDSSDVAVILQYAAEMREGF